MSARAQQLVHELGQAARTADSGRPESAWVHVGPGWLEAIAEHLVDELGWIPPEALAQLQREHDELEAAVDRIRRLHDQDDSVLARGTWCPADGEPEPCKTVRALNGPPGPPG